MMRIVIEVTSPGKASRDVNLCGNGAELLTMVATLADLQKDLLQELVGEEIVVRHEEK